MKRRPTAGGKTGMTARRKAATPPPTNLTSTPCSPSSSNSAEARPAHHDGIAVPGQRTPCVVVHLSCGLGNQMFQYAAGRSLALRTGARLILDATSFTRRNARRKFALSDCNLPAKVSIAGYKDWPTAPIVRFPVSRHRSIRKAARFIHAMGDILGADASHKKFSVFVERGMAFEPGFCDLGAQTYLAGFWQSARYFDDVGHLIRNDLRLTRKPNAANAQWLQRILAANSVCVHVRRGDYLSSDVHGLCSANYYRLAMQLMRDRLSNPQFFVFSDDWQWCREHFVSSDATIVDANDANAAADELRLMGACRHHVIANSSLSWWGAWLATSPGQIVVAPQPWFTKIPPSPDILPIAWLTLPRD
jgi:Glycosyl transferase family 11